MAEHFSKELCEEKHKPIDCFIEKWESRIWAINISVMGTLIVSIASLTFQVLKK